ncbi:MAG TPA: hypothetical protein VF210_06185 [Pseudomonadales bacterium]
MRFLIPVAVVAALASSPAAVRADCSCLCLDGAYRPVCTSAEEVSQNRNLCLALAQRTCPAAPAGDSLATLHPPTEGVDNCREAEVFDDASGEFLTARVCDVTLNE